MPTNSTRETTASDRSGGCCCLLFAALPIGWFIAALVLPEQAFWWPVWLGAVMWNGADGRGGIHHLLG
ncbi:hypothetical protein OG429_03535 [Streptomyces sp. NBC_00190]|uniref:hypothetical protein n=1 Tax=unclassified Streptomyces TaxID=2593676 RepID=UPI002E2BDE0F|nr:hypothetical protein [Streptomyces sp. NBC_00190]WSZ38472.1 hypothetical protein OG239_06540 [Streptomyces sp. NBC_00868]